MLRLGAKSIHPSPRGIRPLIVRRVQNFHLRSNMGNLKSLLCHVSLVWFCAVRGALRAAICVLSQTKPIGNFLSRHCILVINYFASQCTSCIYRFGARLSSSVHSSGCSLCFACVMKVSTWQPGALIRLDVRRSFDKLFARDLSFVLTHFLVGSRLSTNLQLSCA